MDNLPGNPPGVYRLEVNEDNILILRTSNDASLLDFKFDAPAGSGSTFTFEINIPGATFSEPPVTPGPEQQFGILPLVRDDRTVLDLQVTPPDPLQENQEFHFIFKFDGADPIQADPTIVEKPPETPPPGDQE